MRLLKRVAVALGVVVAAFVVVGFLLPRRVRVERSIVIDAPQATVFTVLNGFRHFNKWSPWAGVDPAASYTYGGPASGVGARMSWAGDAGTVGSGSLAIVESRPFEQVTVDFDFGPTGVTTSTFVLVRDGPGTRVTWRLDNDAGASPLARYVNLTMDRLVGDDFERGLAGLQRFAEGLPKADFAVLSVEVTTAPPVVVAYVTTASSTDERAIATAIGGAYAQVGRFMAAYGLEQAAPPITINTKWGAEGYEFEAAIPINRQPERPVPAESAVRLKQTYGGRVLKTVHRGAYRGMRDTYDRLFAYLAAHGFEQAGPPWDEYVSDPGQTPEADLVTHVYVPIR